MTGLDEAGVEAAGLGWLAELGWSVAHGAEVNPDSAPLERADYGAVVLDATLREALARLNLQLPAEALRGAVRRLTRPEGTTVEARNRVFHRMVVDGVTVEYRDGGRVRGAQARVIDFDDPANNDWLAVNQFTVVENRIERRPDVVLFVNGLPLGVIELKNPTDADATIWTAWQQLQTYKADLPTLFSMNAALMVSDGLEARLGTLTAGREWFKPWRTVSGEELAEDKLPQLQVLLQGVCDHRRFLDLVRDFIVFEDDGSGWLDKKIAGYHQFHAVQAAVDETLRAAALQHAASRADAAGRRPGGEPGDRRIGVVWHTQGSGKSLTMAFNTGRIVREPAMSNPTVVVLTDRNDLDDQLFSTFSRCADLLRQPPVQATSRADLRQLPDISVLSEEFLAEVRGLPQRNLAVEALRRLLQGEVTRRRSRNVVQARSFAEMLENSIRRYQNRAIEAAQVIEELIGLAEEIREADARGEQLGLTDEELAFYDALETNDNAVKVLGDETLRTIACELVETVRSSVKIDWTMRENVRADIRRLVRRTLRRHGYPPDKQEKATQTVLEQAEALSAVWAEAA